MLKTTESAFTNFVRDKYTTLKEVDDRILSTSIDLSYTFSPIEITKPSDTDVEEFTIPVRPPSISIRACGDLCLMIILVQADIAPGSVWDTSVPVNARKVTLDIFASDNSASVQVRFYLLLLFCSLSIYPPY